MRVTADESIYKRMVEAAQAWNTLDNAHDLMSEHDDMCGDCLDYIKDYANEREAVAKELLAILNLDCPACRRKLAASDFWGERGCCFKCDTALSWASFEEPEAKE